MKNGDETDVDCGGKSAPACDDMKACLVKDDCKSGVCSPNFTCLGGVLGFVEGALGEGDAEAVDRGLRGAGHQGDDRA